MNDELDNVFDEEVTPDSPENSDNTSVNDPKEVTDSPVTSFMDEFQQNNELGDPFRLVQKASRTSKDIIASSEPNEDSRLFGLSQSTNAFVDQLGSRLNQSAQVYEQSSRLKLSSSLSTSRDNIAGRNQSRFISRPLAEDYQAILKKPGEFKAVFFQFQQQDILSSVLTRLEPTTVTTQQAGFSSKTADETTAQILLGNEVSRAAAKLRSSANVFGVQAYGSFHPKVGYVSDSKQGLTSFIGTQNITPALANNNSLESLLSFSVSSEGLRSPSSVEEFAASEIYQLTNAITGMVQKQPTYRPGQLRRELLENQVTRSYLYIEQEIYQRISQALSTSAFNPVSRNDKVVISMGEISILLKQSKGSGQLVSSITELARQGRLTVVTDQKRTTKFLDELRSNSSLNFNKSLVDTLIKTKSLQTAPTGYQHDKTIAIFDPQMKLQFFNIGSANFSADSLTALKDLTSGEYFDSALSVLKKTQSYDENSPINLDVNLMMGSGRYADQTRRAADPTEYLAGLSNQLYQHYSTLTAGRLQGTSQYQVNYLAEKSTNFSQVEVLRRKLESLSKELGGIIEVEGRYDLQQSAAQTGIKVRVRSVDSPTASTTLNLTVDRHGNVVILDTNKVVTGSIFVNKSQSGRQLPTGEILNPGQSTKLTGIDTAVGMVATVARELSYQSRYALVDQVYSRLQHKSNDLNLAAGELLSQTIKSIDAGLDYSNKSTNLNEVISDIATKSNPSDYAELVRDSHKVLASSSFSSLPSFYQDLTEAQKMQRERSLFSVFTELTDRYNLSNEEAGFSSANRLLQVLDQDTDKVLSDIKLALILSTKEGSREFARAQQTQAGKIVSEITAPFLATHELGYSSAQAQYRLPIYSESQTYLSAEMPSSVYRGVLESGFLNPAEVKPGTRIGTPGQFFRPVGATSHAKTLKLPGFGGVRSLVTLDSDISTGAAVAYDLPNLLKSTSGLAMISKEVYQQQLQRVLHLLNSSQSSSLSKELEKDFEQDYLYSLPFPKAEQIPQRLKNVVGSRPALDINPELVRKMRNLQHSSNFSGGHLLAGRLKEALPESQFFEAAERTKELGNNYSAVEDYYRSLEVDPMNTKRGFIGGRSMKRVALIGGVSLIGDSSYLNAGYESYAGDIHRLTVKVNSKQVRNQLQVQDVLTKYLGQGSVIFSTPVPHENFGLVTRITEHLASTKTPLTVETIQASLKQLSPENASSLSVKLEGQKFSLYYKEGLYVPKTKDQKTSYERVGTFNSDGLLTVNEVGTRQETHNGVRNQPITIKFPTFGKRFQEGISLITSTPQLVVSESGTIIVSTDVLTTWKPGTGSRPSGSGLVKGPFSVLQSSVFDDIQKRVSERTTLRPSALSQEKIYGLYGYGHFKGFNYETGMYLLSQEDSRSALQSQSGKSIARSLSLLFLGDKELKSALKESLAQDNLSYVADSIDAIKATDFSAVKDGKPSTPLGKVALGLTLLSNETLAGEESVKGSLASVKKTVLSALRGNVDSIEALERQSKKLIHEVTTNSKSSIRFNNNSLVFNESDVLARGAGLLAHLSFVSDQLFNSSISPKNSSVKNLYERDLSDASRYLSDIAHRNVVDTIAATAGISLPAATPENRGTIHRKLQLLQAMLRNDVVVEDLKEVNVSRSLVPAGMKDEASLEYQYLLGMSSSYLKAFTKIGGGTQASKELQSAFSRLVGSFRVDLPSANAQIGYRLALPSEQPGFFTPLASQTNEMLLSYTQMADNLSLIDSYSDSVFSEESLQRRSSHVRRIRNLQRLSTGVTTDDAASLDSRATNISKFFGLSYFSPESDSPESRLHIKYLQKSLRLSPGFTTPETSPLQVVSKVLRRSYQSYVESRKTNKKTGEANISFTEFVQEGRGGHAVQALEDKYKLVSQLSKDSHRLVGVPLTTDDQILTSRIEAQLERLNTKSLAKVEQQYQTNLYKEFVQGSLNLESKLQQRVASSTNPNFQAQAQLQEIQNTRQVLFPKVSTQLITEGENKGKYQTTVLDPALYEPSTGVLLGTDILRRAPLLFPGYTDEALKHQVDLRQRLHETEKVRKQLMTPGTVLSETQVQQLQGLHETLEASRHSVMRLLDTDFTRKAMGDKQNYTGSVGVAIGSFALDSGEAVIGKRFYALTKDRDIVSVLKNQFELIDKAPSKVQQDLLRSTHALVTSLLPSSHGSNAQSANPSDRTQIPDLFDNAIRLAGTNRLSSATISELKLNTFAELSGLPNESLSSMKESDLNTLLSTSTGSIRRGGAPAGSSAVTTNQNYYDLKDVNQLQAKLTAEGSGLIPEAQRFQTGMIAPAVGRLLPMLGDFDGDAYQLLLTGIGEHATELKHVQKRALTLSKKLNYLERNLSSNPNLQSQYDQTSSEYSDTLNQLNTSVLSLNQYQAQYDKAENKSLDDVRQWVGSYLALPDFITDKDKGLSTGTLMSMVQQMSGTMPQIQDGSHLIQKTEEHFNLLSTLFNERLPVAQDTLSLAHPETQERVNQLLHQNSGLSLSMVEGVLGYAKQQGASSTSQFEDSTRDYLALQSNLSMTMEQINKSYKKGGGSLLNPFDFEGVQSVVGQAGTELIGKTYNVLVPLIDQVMFDQALVTSLQTTGDASFRNVIDENLAALASESTSQKEQVEILKLRSKLLKQDHQSVQQQLSARFSATTGTLASMQQLIRDALKEKSDKGIVAVLKEATFEGKPLTEALESIDESDPLKADKQRISILKHAVMTRIGPDLSVGQGMSESSGRLRTSKLDGGLTGFGALLKLAEYSMTDEDDLYQKFVEEPGLKDTYADHLKNRQVSNVSEFAASQVLNLVERSQASFITSTFTDSAKSLLLGQLQQFHRDADVDTLSPANKRIHTIMSEYEQEKTAGEIPADELNNRLLQEVTLQQVQSRNSDQQVMSIQQVQELRQSYLETQKVRFDDGDYYQRMQAANVDTYNSYLRMLQRGQQPNVSDALILSEYRMDALSAAIEDQGMNSENMSTSDQLRMAKLLGSRPGSGILKPAEQTYLAKALLRKSKSGLTGLQGLQNSTAAMTQGVFSLIDQLENVQGDPEYDRGNELRKQLAGVYKSGLNVDEMIRTGLVTPRSPHATEDLHRLTAGVNSQLKKITSATTDQITTPDNKSDASRSPMLHPDSRLEALGIFVAPALLAFAGSNPKLDERSAMLGLDVLQATATLTSNTDRLTSRITGQSASSNAALNFTVGRVKQSIESEGFAIGGVQGLIQEGLYQSLAQVSHKAVDFAVSRLPGRANSGVNTIATVAAETLSTVLSLGFSRSAVGQKTRTSEVMPDRVGDILKNVTEQIWQMVEQVQLALLDPQYEVMDTAENQNLDFELSAIPSELEQNIESGLIVIDENNNPLPTEFENTMSDQAQLSSMPR